MIALNSRDGGSSFQVYEDDKLIGLIRRQEGPTGEKYLASVDKDGKEESARKEFGSPRDALQWIEKYQGKEGSGSFA
jgi:hypothetical protein